jgi:hypothetical protein
VGGEHRQQTELGGCQGRGARGERAAGPGDFRPEAAGLHGEDAKAGAQGEDFGHLLEKDLRCSDVGQREVAPGELDSRLYGKMRQRVGQGRPKALCPGQFRHGARPVALVQRYPGGHGMHDRDGG